MTRRKYCPSKYTEKKKKDWPVKLHILQQEERKKDCPSEYRFYGTKKEENFTTRDKKLNKQQGGFFFLSLKISYKAREELTWIAELPWLFLDVPATGNEQGQGQHTTDLAGSGKSSASALPSESVASADSCCVPVSVPDRTHTHLIATFKLWKTLN